MNTKLFSSSLGINNKVPSHRLPYDDQSGIVSFESALNVLIGISGDITTRRGSSLAVAGSFQSVFNTIDGFYVVQDREIDSAIMKAQISSSGAITLTGIRSGLAKGARIAFTQLNDEILYCNGYQNGKIVSDVSAPWTVNDWTGPESNIKMMPTPIGNHLDILSGRVLVSVNSELFFSEYGLIGLIDEVGNRVRMESKIIMICAVQTGVYISDTKAIYFLKGLNPSEWTCTKVLNYPAIEWGINQDLVDPSLFGITSFELAGLFATVNGPVIGMPNGIPLNLIDKALIMPDCGKQSGAILVVDETTIIQTGV